MNMRRMLVAGAVFSTLVLAAPKARAADFHGGPNEFAFHFGFQGGWWDWTPGGPKLSFGYGKFLGLQKWLDLELNLVFGDRWDDDCVWDGHRWHCAHPGYRGVDLGFFGGLKWKFDRLIPPFVPYAKVGGQVSFLSYPDIFGMALAVRGGGGFTYYIVPNFGLGAELNMALGFNFINHDVGFWFYWAMDFLVGLEVLF